MKEPLDLSDEARQWLASGSEFYCDEDVPRLAALLKRIVDAAWAEEKERCAEVAATWHDDCGRQCSQVIIGKKIATAIRLSAPAPAEEPIEEARRIAFGASLITDHDFDSFKNRAPGSVINLCMHDGCYLPRERHAAAGKEK